MKNQPVPDMQLAGKRKTSGGSDVRVWSPGDEPNPTKKPQWRIKTYYAGSMQNAISQARAELGEDAIIMSSRNTPAHNRHLGEYEVVFGVGPVAAPAAPAPAASTSPARNQPFPSNADSLRGLGPEPVHEKTSRNEHNPRPSSLDLSGVRQQLLQIQEMLSQTGIGPVLPRLPQAAEWHAHFVAGGLSDELATQIMNHAAERLPRFTGGQYPVRDALAEALKIGFRTDSTLGVPGARARIAILVGPPGCGKTTTLIKLAVREGMLTQAPTTLIGFDHERIAAVQQMESFASILGVSFRAIDTIAALQQHLDNVIPGELVLIDTNGISSSDLDSGKELAEFLSSRKDVDVHLVIPANMRDSDRSRMIDRFALFGPKKLLFTMVDETASFGALVREASRTGKPLSFLSTGRHIPEDLERATPDGVARLVLHGGAWRKTSDVVR